MRSNGEVLLPSHSVHSDVTCSNHMSQSREMLDERYLALAMRDHAASLLVSTMRRSSQQPLIVELGGFQPEPLR